MKSTQESVEDLMEILSPAAKDIITDQAVLLAQRAMVIEGLISQNLEHLILPEPVVVGTSPDVVIKTDPSAHGVCVLDEFNPRE